MSQANLDARNQRLIDEGRADARFDGATASSQPLVVNMASAATTFSGNGRWPSPAVVRRRR